ncbi:Retrovirus-related Pol polyprotein from type-1 retrotransposable element R1 [Nymphon striatum]|nr:Retrovirus-related Pol polyprotein from type-1 retrotransposable element R1 [Nymphon striatum]
MSDFETDFENSEKDDLEVIPYQYETVLQAGTGEDIFELTCHPRGKAIEASRNYNHLMSLLYKLELQQILQLNLRALRIFEDGRGDSDEEMQDGRLGNVECSLLSFKEFWSKYICANSLISLECEAQKTCWALVQTCRVASVRNTSRGGATFISYTAAKNEDQTLKPLSLIYAFSTPFIPLPLTHLLAKRIEIKKNVANTSAEALPVVLIMSQIDSLLAVMWELGQWLKALRSRARYQFSIHSLSQAATTRFSSSAHNRFENFDLFLQFCMVDSIMVEIASLRSHLEDAKGQLVKLISKDRIHKPDTVKFLNKSMKVALAKLSNIEKSVSEGATVVKERPSQPTYANVVAKAVASHRSPPETIIVESQDADIKTAGQLQALVKDSVNLREAKIGVTNIRHAGTKLIIKTQNSVDKGTLVNLINNTLKAKSIMAANRKIDKFIKNNKFNDILNIGQLNLHTSKVGTAALIKKAEELSIDLLSKFKKSVQHAKRVSWRAFCSQVSRTNPFSDAYKLCRSEFRRKHLDEPLLDSNGHRYADVAEECKALMNYHLGDEDGIQPETIVTPEGADDRNISAAEINRIVRCLPDKAPGPDGFDRAITRSLFDHFRELITQLIMACFRLSVFPDVWKEACVILIPKIAKDKYNSPDKFRPISLISTFGKIIEKLLKSRLMHYLQTNSLLSANQFGFLPNRSTAGATKMLVEAAKEALLYQGYCLAVTLDIKGAFDNVRWTNVINSLNKKRVPPNLKRMISNYLNRRRATLHWQGSTVHKYLTKGCPQGSALSPYLWLLVVDDLLESHYPISVKVVAYADDILVFAKGDDLTTLIVDVNVSLDTICNWALSQSLTFSYAKCASILFTRRLKYRTPQISLNGRPLPLVKNFKYLGLIIDDHLTWNKHIIMNTNRVIQFMFLFRRISRNTWGASGGAVKRIYKAALIPMLTYNCQVWAEALKLKYNVKILKRTQRQIAMAVLKSYRDISYAAAIALAGLVPLEIEIKRIARIFDCIGNNTLAVNNINYDLDLRVPVDKIVHPSLSPPTWVNSHLKPITTQLNVKNLPLKIPHPLSMENKFLIIHKLIYTDGSKVPEVGVGAAFTLTSENYFRDKKLRLANHCNIFQAEMVAILQSLKTLYLLETMNENILIVTDSLSSILAIQNFDNRHRLVNSVIKYVDKLDMNNCKIYLEWVKSHSGNALNDKVDLLAKQAVSINYSKTFSRVPIDFIKSQIGIEARKEYHQWYSSLDNNLRIKTLFPKLRDLTSFIGSYEIGFIESQVITGHGHLKEYLHRRHVTVDPYCECDSVSIQNADHLLFACSTYRSISSPLINKLNRYKIPLAVQQVIKTKLAGLLFKTFRKIYEEMLQLQS